MQSAKRHTSSSIIYGVEWTQVVHNCMVDIAFIYVKHDFICLL